MEEVKKTVAKYGHGTAKPTRPPKSHSQRKQGNKAKEIKKKARRPSYVVVPKGKILKNKAIARLENANQHYYIAKAVDLLEKYHRLAIAENLEDPSPDIELKEQEWRKQQQDDSDEENRKEEKRIERLKAREEKRKKRAEMTEKKELHRRKYRLNPRDHHYKYVEGYEKRRHRITKDRFMNCVNIPMFKEVLEKNVDLRDSALWDETLYLPALTFTEVCKLKEHIQQFEVIVEALKQGIFDKPGCDDIPVIKVRRKRNPEPTRRNFRFSKYVPDLPASKFKDKGYSKSRARELKKRLSFPPYVPLETGEDEKDDSKGTGWFEKVSGWLHFTGEQKENDGMSYRSKKSAAAASKNPHVKSKQPQTRPTFPEEYYSKETTPKAKLDVNEKPKGTMESKEKSKQKELAELKEKLKMLNQNMGKVRPSKKGPGGTSLNIGRSKSVPTVKRGKTGSSSKEELETGSQQNLEDEDENHPFGDYLTITIPPDLLSRKKFIHKLVEQREKNNNLKTPNPEVQDEEEDAKKRRELWYESKHEPLQMLHQDEKDSDIWTVTTTTTTDSYASWRRLPDITNMSKKMENLASPIDNTLAWRLLLLLFVVWEIGIYVRKRLDDVYYNIFTFYLFRENIWHYSPGVFAPVEKSAVVNVQEYIHLGISMCSLSIIHRKNECVSLLFAFSLMVNGMFATGVYVHDALYLPEPLRWGGVVILALHLFWKSLSICLFVGYHYYSAGYIRKAREFKHRKTTMHNHEINVKGTKGILKRKQAWNWMTRHARNTNLRKLNKKFPDVKDGNFPMKDLDKEIKFCEAKEVRLYAQTHNLNIGYPYNKLKDMKRYVFGDLEKSDYSEQDVDEGIKNREKRRSVPDDKQSNPVTIERWKQWKLQDEGRIKTLRENRLKSQSQGVIRHAPGGGARTRLHD